DTAGRPCSGDSPGMSVCHVRSVCARDSAVNGWEAASRAEIATIAPMPCTSSRACSCRATPGRGGPPPGGGRRFTVHRACPPRISVAAALEQNGAAARETRKAAIRLEWRYKHMAKKKAKKAPKKSARKAKKPAKKAPARKPAKKAAPKKKSAAKRK